MTDTSVGLIELAYRARSRRRTLQGFTIGMAIWVALIGMVIILSAVIPPDKTGSNHGAAVMALCGFVAFIILGTLFIAANSGYAKLRDLIVADCAKHISELVEQYRDLFYGDVTLNAAQESKIKSIVVKSFLEGKFAKQGLTK